MKYTITIILTCFMILLSELGFCQPEAVLTCTDGYGSPGCETCDIFIQIKISQLAEAFSGFQIFLKYDTSVLSVSAVHRTYLSQAFEIFLWNQKKDGIMIIGVLGTIEKKSEGPIANIFFKSSGLDLGDYSLTFDVEETILACNCEDPLDLEFVDGYIMILYWDNWTYTIGPHRLDFGSIERGRDSMLTVGVRAEHIDSYVVEDIITDHPDFSVSPTSFIVNQWQTENFFVTFSPSSVGTTSALITVNPGHTFFTDNYIIAVGVGVTSSVGIEDGNRIQDSYHENYYLYQNRPNPFNPTTEIRYQIADGRSVFPATLKIFNVLGQVVRTLVDEVQEPGAYSVSWDGRNDSGDSVPNGLYLYRLRVADFVQTRKCLIVR